MKKANPLASFWISLSRSCMDQDDRWQKVDVISFYFSSTLLLAASTSHRPKSSSSSIHHHEPRRSVCLIREQVCSGRPLWGWAGSAREVEAGDWDRVARPGPAGRGRGGPSLSPFFRGDKPACACALPLGIFTCGSGRPTSGVHAARASLGGRFRPRSPSARGRVAFLPPSSRTDGRRAEGSPGPGRPPAGTCADGWLARSGRGTCTRQVTRARRRAAVALVSPRAPPGWVVVRWRG